MENAVPTENPPAEGEQQSPLPPPPPPVPEPEPVRSPFVVTADIEGARAGRILSLTPKQAETHAASIRAATATDLAVFGRAPAQLD